MDLSSNQLYFLPPTIFQHNPSLTILNVNANHLMFLSFLENMATLKSLTEIHIQKNKLSDVGVEKLHVKFPNLKEIHLQGNEILCERLKEIKDFMKIKNISSGVTSSNWLFGTLISPFETPVGKYSLCNLSLKSERECVLDMNAWEEKKVLRKCQLDQFEKKENRVEEKFECLKEKQMLMQENEKLLQAKQDLKRENKKLRKDNQDRVEENRRLIEERDTLLAEKQELIQDNHQNAHLASKISYFERRDQIIVIGVSIIAFVALISKGLTLSLQFLSGFIVISIIGVVWIKWRWDWQTVTHYTREFSQVIAAVVAFFPVLTKFLEQILQFKQKFYELMGQT